MVERNAEAILCYGFRLKDKEGEEENLNLSRFFTSKKRMERILNLFSSLMVSNSNQDEILAEISKEENYNDEYFKFDDLIAELSGLKAPFDHVDSVKYHSDESYKKDWEDYWHEHHKASVEIGVEMVMHCTAGRPMYILAVKESVQNAYWGLPHEIGQSIEAKPEWREKIRAFCERVGIEFVEPQFIMCVDIMV